MMATETVVTDLKEPSVDGLLTTLKEQTVHLLQQGEDLSAQMIDLHESLDSLVHSPMDPSSHHMYVARAMRDKRPALQEDPSELGYDSGYNTSDFPSVKIPLQKKDKRSLTNETCMSESRSQVGGTRQEDIPQGSSCHRQLCCGQIQSSKTDLPGYYCPSKSTTKCNTLAGISVCNCYNCEGSSPVTVSSGYSSDKDLCVREEDIDHLLSPCKTASEDTQKTGEEDTVSCCDSELVRIYESFKELGRPLSECYQDQVLTESSPSSPVNDKSEELNTQEFKPINYESLCRKQKELSDRANGEHLCITYTPLISQSLCPQGKDRQTVKKQSLKRHHSMFEKQSKPYICVAQSVDTSSDITPPPITDLPGFHPAWCGDHHLEGTDTEEVDEDPKAFGVSLSSAFRPYPSGVCKSRSFSEKDCVDFYEVPIEKRLANMMQDSQMSGSRQCPCDSGYSLVKSFSKRTLTYSCSSDSGNSSCGYCLECQSPAFSSSDEGIFESPEQSVLYEPIDEDPIYEYVPNTPCVNKPDYKDTPPKLPERNPVRKQHPSRSHTSRHHCDRRKDPVKLEDIIRPSDIVDTGGKHLYTVADVLASVEKLSEDMPDYMNESTVRPCTREAVQRSASFLDTLRNKSHLSEDMKGLKKIFSPKLKPKKGSCKAIKKDSTTVKDSVPSNSCVEEKPESVHGLLVIPTHYGLQFKSTVQCTPPPKHRSHVTSDHVTSGHVTPVNSTSPTIAWNTLGSSNKEIFC